MYTITLHGRTIAVVDDLAEARRIMSAHENSVITYSQEAIELYMRERDGVRALTRK